ncbi:MAG: C69 family dipeptidase [Arcicella sp.]|nr:C69 family dipeptidase [Arcicella sp.]
MCDTFIALPSITKNRTIIFGKNSDREPNEAQGIVRFPRRKNTEKTLSCTFTEISQVSESYEVILSKPFQMWGAEMGVNEFGVTIGNEAVFTKIKIDKTNQGLTGMDLLRLALERSKTAEEALECITDLLKTYGQDACGGYENKDFFYHNSFIIADKNEAYILETAGSEWVAKRVKDYGSISNGLTIGEDFDMVSENAISFAQEKGWHKTGSFNFQKSYSNSLMSWASGCKIRQKITSEGISKTGFTVKYAIELLSSHHLSDDKFAPHKGTTGDVCMHATSTLNPSHTVGSMIVEIRKDNPITIWFTGTSNPCLSVYKPFFLGGNGILNETFQNPEAKFDRKTLWWIAERLHRLGNLNYPKLKEIINPERTQIQAVFLAEEEKLINENASLETLQDFSKNSFQTAFKALIDWNNKAAKIAWRPTSWNPFYYFSRRRMNSKVGL